MANDIETTKLIIHTGMSSPVPELSMTFPIGGKTPLITRKLPKATDSFLALQTGWSDDMLIINGIRAKTSPRTRTEAYLIEYCFVGPDQSIFCLRKENER